MIQPPSTTSWHLTNRADPRAAAIADRHYNRQHVGAPQFVPPGRCVVLVTEQADAFWISSWPYPAYVQHAWAGAWINSAFRREGGLLASVLIREAVAVTRWVWPDVPDLGMVTFIDTSKVRHKRDPGRCYRRAGFVECGHTKGGLLALQLLPAAMPEPVPPLGMQLALEVPA